MEKMEEGAPFFRSRSTSNFVARTAPELLVRKYKGPRLLEKSWACMRRDGPDLHVIFLGRHETW